MFVPFLLTASPDEEPASLFYKTGSWPPSRWGKQEWIPDLGPGERFSFPRVTQEQAYSRKSGGVQEELARRERMIQDWKSEHWERKWGRRERWYRLQKESWEITHISFSFVANLMPRFLLEVCSTMQAERLTIEGEASRGGQCNKLPWADPTAEHGSYYTLAAILFFPYGVSDLSCTLR